MGRTFYKKSAFIIYVFFLIVMNMNDNDLFNRLLILRSPNIGPVRYNALVAQFGGIDMAARAINADDGVRDCVAREMEMARKLNITYICDDMDVYPKNLKMIKNHPPVLSVRGNVATLTRRAVGIVGTRHATVAGMNIVADIAEKFASHGVAVVSGMAMGTDAAAHRGALRARGAENTVAVVAGGVDYIWPVENESLYWDIVERGAVVSEMPVGFVPQGQNFVMRNRWIAGIGDFLILGEADLKSGSMKTAQFAHESNRKIFAIPSHPSDSRAIGPNSLIKSGVAELCNGASDFFDDEKNEKKLKKNEQKNASENSLLDAIGTIPVSESVLSEIVKKTVSEIKSDLVILELQGLVRKVDGGYVRA